MSIRAWARKAQKGDALLYHTGLLMRDRQRNGVLHSVADVLWSMHERGALALVQHKRGDFDYDYIAIKT